MDGILNEMEVRVLGSLMEKQITTPDYYPLTLNAVMHACNQLSNREPVVSYDEDAVTRALESLQLRNMVYVFYGSDSRVPKYKQMMTTILHLSPPETAVMCVMMLRGPQTVGELRGRCARLYEFADLAEVETTLEGLFVRDDDPPLAVRLPRQAGRKESRYAHTLAGEITLTAPDELPTPVKTHTRHAAAEDERIPQLESKVETLRHELDELKQKFADFKKQFD
ncbi:MAG: YceH family protein [Pyrinomonadaceae bacterium]|nr:YceH family protein [Pyrinomonadaceae bacterium]